MDNSSKKEDSLLNKIIENKYKTTKKLGEGSFGKIYQCECLQNKKKYAMKFESIKKGHCLLESENKIMEYLKGRKLF